MRSPAVIEKGRKLANQGRIKHDEGAQVYLVDSESGQRYTVIVSGAGYPRCDCPASGYCSHIEATVHSRVREAM